MNKIEQLPKTITFNSDDYELNVWITAWEKLCIGYRPKFRLDEYGRLKDSLCSVVVEKDKKPFKIENSIENYINAYIGNMPTFDDACDELADFIEKNKDKFKIEY